MGTRGYSGLYFALLSLSLLTAGSAKAAAPAQRGWAVELGAEHLWPTKADRQITTTSLDLVVGRAAFDSCCLVWRAGLTATAASGHILQYGEDFREVRLDSDGLGIGPTGIVRLQTPELLRLTLSFEGSVAFIVYDRPFPAGGDWYDFMLRVGPSLGYRIDSSWSVAAGVRWMHVSNGQGLTPKNPSYEGRGLVLWVAREF